MTQDFNPIFVAQALLLGAYIIHSLSLLMAALKVDHWEKTRGVKYLTNMLLFTSIGTAIKALGVLYVIGVQHPIVHADDMTEYIHNLVYIVFIFAGQLLEVWFSVGFALYLVGILNGLIKHDGNPPSKVTVEVSQDANKSVHQPEE